LRLDAVKFLFWLIFSGGKMYILSREEMYEFDKYTIEKIGVPGKELMENAGKGCAEFIRDRILSTIGSKIAIFCGAGNNGGDGFVIARYLKIWKFSPVIFLLGSPQKMSTETLENYQDCLKLKIPVNQIESNDFCLKEFNLIVDAIFGVGLKGNVHGWRAEVIKKINEVEIPVVSVDIASGIDANTGQADIAVEADFTLTMANYKYGHFLGQGREKSGETLIIDIGIPKYVYEKFTPQATLVTSDNVIYPRRSRFSHKGDYGRVGIIAGSPGFSGAAIMACRSALRSGAGLITLLHPAGMEMIFETQLLEVMTYTLPENNEKTELIADFQNKLNTMDVLLIGPGIGTADKTKFLLEKILKTWHKPLVLDADALNILSWNRELLELIKNKPVLLTPHLGEFARLTEKTISEIQTDPLEHLSEFITKYNCNVLLKSFTTILADKSGFIFDISGNDGLSTGGSGDVLAGIIVSFLAQKLDIKNAAISASYLLGKTAETLAEIRKPASIIPSDVIENLFKY